MLATTYKATIDLESLPVLTSRESDLERVTDEDSMLHEIISSHQASVEKAAILQKLKSCDGNKAKTAEASGISRKEFRKT